MCMSKPSMPAPPPPPPPLPAVPKEVDEAVKMSRNDERARARAAAGSASTIKTSSMGLTDPAATTKKQLIGQ